MPQCLKLTASSLSTLLSQGWTQLGGPYNSQNECLINCGGISSAGSSGAGSQFASSSSGFSSSSSSFTQTYIQVPCCNDILLPSTMNLTVQDAGNCACLAGSYPLTYYGYYGNADRWRAIGANFDVLFACFPGFGGWELTDTYLLDNTQPMANCNVGDTFTLTFTCSPFSVTFSNTSMGPQSGSPCCCTGASNVGDVNFIITF